MFLEHPELPQHLRSFLDSGLMLDAWLADSQHRSFSDASLALLERTADELAREHWHEPLITETLGRLPALGDQGRRAAAEVLRSTAVVVAHEVRGRIEVDEAIALTAVERLQSFLRASGFAALVRVIMTVHVADNLSAVCYYRRLTEVEFVTGLRHRPWSGQPLDDALALGVASGSYRIVVRDGVRWVVPTARGRQRLKRARELLAASGYRAARRQLTVISHFNLGHDLDRLVAQLLPDRPRLRTEFTRFARLAPGSAVVDIGCGRAEQWFEGGLLAALGGSGRLVGVDPAYGQLERARRRAAVMRAQNVDFVQARGEELPFGDDSFDAALLVTVLEYGDAPRILREAARVTRPGGAIVAAGLIDRALPQALLRRWAGPVLRLARKYRLPMRRTHSGPNLAGLLRAAGLVEVETLQLQAHIDLSDIDALADSTRQGGSLVQGVLFDLPWAARQDLLRDLVEHGRRLTRSLEPARLVVPIPLHFARGVVPAG